MASSIVRRAAFRAVVAVASSRASPRGKVVTANEFVAAVVALGVDGVDDEVLLKKTFASKKLDDGAASLLRKFTPNAP